MLTCLSFLYSCASVPEERKVTIQEVGQRGLSVGIITKLYLDSGSWASDAAGNQLHDLLVAENVNAGLAHRQSVKAAFEAVGIPIRKSLFIKSGAASAVFLKGRTCRQIADITKYKEVGSQSASKDKCSLPAPDGKLVESALPYLTMDWDDPINESMPESEVKALSAKIDARYLMLFYFSGRERTERVKKLDTGFKLILSLYPPALAENVAKRIEGVVSDERLYSTVVYDTYGGKLRKVFNTNKNCAYYYTPTDPRAWSEAQVRLCAVDDIAKDRRVFR